MQITLPNGVPSDPCKDCKSIEPGACKRCKKIPRTSKPRIKYRRRKAHERAGLDKTI